MAKTLDLPDWVNRGISEIFPSQNPDQNLANKLNESNKEFRKLRVKFGIDPTGTDIHIGHSILFKKLRSFQDNGHVAILILSLIHI